MLVPQPIRVATECSGLEPLPYALDGVGLSGKYSMVWACERDPTCREMLRACHGEAAPPIVHEDINLRAARAVPDHDLYVAGFPCQPFSSMGLRQGVADAQGRGTIIQRILECLEAKLPRAFLLENVRGLVTEHKQDFDQILTRLRALNRESYYVSWRVLNTEQHGIPQHRERVYILGILKTATAGKPKFKWPAPLAPKRLTLFLDRQKPMTKVERHANWRIFYRKADSQSVRVNLWGAIQKAEKEKQDITDPASPVVVDLDGTKSRYMVNRCPCITRARGSTGFFLLPFGRRMSLAERLRLQGLPTKILRHQKATRCSEHKLGAMVGNAMSVNVLERLLARLLPACGLVPAGAVHDRWEPKKPSSQ
jgi:DNA-cytosine methyltransferase